MKRVLTALLAFLLAAPAAAQRNERLSAEERFELGQRYMNRGYYTKALEQFNRLRNYYRDDPHAVLAELAIADLHFRKAEWDQARVAYEDFLRLHPRHPKADYATWRMGLAMWRKAPKVAARDQTWTRHAVNTWAGFTARYPESELREEVGEHLEGGRDRLARKEFLIGRYYFRRDSWAAAVGRLERLLRTYPQSSSREEAMALLGQARWHLGDGTRARELLQELDAAGAEGRHVRGLRKLVGAPAE